MQSRSIELMSMGVVGLITVFILVEGADLIIPLAVAVLVWYLLNAFAQSLMTRVPGGQKAPEWLWLGISLVLLVAAMSLTFNLLAQSLSGVVEAAPGYQDNIQNLLNKGAALLGLENTPSLTQVAKAVNVKWAIGQAVGLTTKIAGNIGLIMVYVVFLVVEQKSFDRKIDALFPEKEDKDGVRGVLRDIQLRIQDYIWIKTIMSVLTGVVSFAIMKAFGVDYAFFWAFVIYLLNYIPTIGSLLGVSFPALLTLIQFPSIMPFVVVTSLLGATQFIIGNLLEPKLMGDKMNISSLVVLLSLAVWGKLWGVTGMFLCVPLTVIAMIIFSQFPKTRPLAILLSSNGQIRAAGEEE